jgi:clan AA aspartic protease (TIGR02281 family)
MPSRFRKATRRDETMKAYSRAIAALLSAALSAGADTIRLTNGNAIGGIIAKETTTHVFLDLGVGSTTIPRANIQSIQRSDESANLSIRDDWRKDYYLHKKFLPAGMEELAAGFAALNEKRDAAIKAHAHLAGMKDAGAALRTEIEALQAQHVAMNQRLTDTDPNADLQAYNAIVIRNNELGAQRVVKADQLEKHLATRQPAIGTISDYLEHLAAFQQELATRLKQARATPAATDTRYVLERIAAVLTSRDGEMSTATVETQRLHNGAIVAVSVNGKAQGRFLLDTGSSMMTFSDEFAGRLKLDLSKARDADCVMADGRRVKAKYVVLDSVAAGSARASNVEAAILPPPGEDLDGLLGMSFLRNFVVQFDGATGKLALKQFSPQ